MLQSLKTDDVHALHRTRIATRRLRELLPMLQLDAAVSDKLSRRLRKVTEQLGHVRELDVLNVLVDELRESDRHAPEALSRIASGIEEERKALGSDIKDIYAEAKSAGFDVKVIRQLIRIRKQEPAEVEELETLLDVYRRALGM